MDIALYPVDIRGVLGYDSVSGAVPTADPTAGRVGTTRVSSGPGAPNKSGNSAVGMYGGVSASMVEYRNQDYIAEQTGGRAYHGNNDIRHLLEQATEQGASFYTLSYSPPDSKDDAKQHNIEVKLAEPSYHLAYRRFYIALPDDRAQPAPKPGSYAATHPAPKQVDTLSISIAHGGPLLHDLIFSARVRTEGEARLNLVDPHLFHLASARVVMLSCRARRRGRGHFALNHNNSFPSVISGSPEGI